MKLFDPLERLNYRRRDAVYRGSLRLDLLGDILQCVEIITIEFDGDLGGDARNHVTDQMGQRLLDFNVDTGNLVFQLTKQLRDDRFTRAAAIRIDGQNILTGVGRFRVFIEFRSSGAADELENLPARIRVGFHKPAKFVIDRGTGSDRRIERRARWQRDIDLDCSLVKRRQKVGPQLQEQPKANSN